MVDSGSRAYVIHKGLQGWMCAVHWVTEWHAVQKSSQSEHVVMNFILTSPMVLLPAARLTHLITKLVLHSRCTGTSDMQWYQRVHITHAWISSLDTCMYVDFPGQMLVIKSVLSWVWLCLAPLFLSRSNVMNISGFVRFFLELFDFLIFFVAGSENLFSKYLMFDSVWHCHSVRFWIAQARCIFLVLVTCENMHISGNCPYSMWSLCGVPGVYVESM